ncbi:MAG TPA: ROK family protein [Bryobacteraceae bacterium]|nr:ROK family protein [Bryobacteraceae bacterium]
MTVVGLDIGGTTIKAGRVDASGRILASASAATPLTLAAMRDVVGALVRDVGDGSASLRVGIGCRGIIDRETTRVDSLPGAASFLEGTLLRDLLDVAAVVAADNDARVAMAGEMRWGAARDRRNAVMLTLGTGVGGAVLAEGQLLRGTGGVAGHLGHITVDPDGPLCICGNHGCLESLFSARAIEGAARAALHRGCDSVLKTGNAPSCEQIFAAAAAGDVVASEVVTRAVRILAGAVAGLVHAFDPEVVILGGQISRAGEALFAPVREQVWRRTRRLLRREVPVIPSELHDPSGVLGAAALVLY